MAAITQTNAKKLKYLQMAVVWFRFQCVKNSLRPSDAYYIICVTKITIIGSDNGLSPERRHSIIRTNAKILLIWPMHGNKLYWNLTRNPYNFIQENVFENVVCETAAILFRFQCVKRENRHCPASRTTLVATRFRVAVICPIIQVPHCIRVFFYFVWFVFINHIFQFYYELCTYCNILDIYLS